MILNLLVFAVFTGPVMLSVILIRPGTVVMILCPDFVAVFTKFLVLRVVAVKFLVFV